jgi:hypothetical protein
MLDAYEPAALWSATVNLFDDEELLEPSAALFRTPIEAALDRTQLIHDLLIGDIVESDSIDRVVPIGVPEGNADSRFTRELDGVATKWWKQTSVADAGGLTYELVPPYVGAIPVACVARYTGKATGVTHASWPPAWLPKFTLYRVTDGVAAEVASHQDSVNQAAYEQPHDLDIPLGDPSHAAGPSDRMLLRLTGETGANAEANQMALLSMRAQWTKP